MIHAALQGVTDDLNEYLARKEPRRYRGQEPAVVSDLVDQEGKVVVAQNDTGATGGSDHVVVSLVNVEEETVGKAQLPYERGADHSIEIVQPEIRVNLFVLFSGFSTMEKGERYLNCLRLVSHVVRFFQHKPRFDQQNTPGLDQGIEKLIPELVSLNFEQQNHLWGALGAKMMPSVLYKLRLLVLQETEDTVSGPLIHQVRARSGALE